jgi:hypothetical protein
MDVFTFIDVTIAMDPAPAVTAPAFASDVLLMNDIWLYGGTGITIDLFSRCSSNQVLTLH